MTSKQAKPRPIMLSRDPQSPTGRLAALKPENPGERTISETADRYMAAIRRSLPDLEHPELCLIFDALGPDWKADEAYNQTLSAEIIEAIDKDRLDHKWEVNGQRLTSRVKRMPYAAQMSLGEMNELFWIHNPAHPTYADTVAACLQMLQPTAKTQPQRRPIRLSPEKAGGSRQPQPGPETPVPSPAENGLEPSEPDQPPPPPAEQPAPLAMPGVPLT